MFLLCMRSKNIQNVQYIKKEIYIKIEYQLLISSRLEKKTVYQVGQKSSPQLSITFWKL